MPDFAIKGYEGNKRFHLDLLEGKTLRDAIFEAGAYATQFDRVIVLDITGQMIDDKTEKIVFDTQETPR